MDPWDNDYGANEQYQADYSPDGNWIVFSRDVEGDGELFVVGRDGRGLTRLTRRPGLDVQPAWRPRQAEERTRWARGSPAWNTPSSP